MLVLDVSSEMGVGDGIMNVDSSSIKLTVHLSYPPWSQLQGQGQVGIPSSGLRISYYTYQTLLHMKCDSSESLLSLERALNGRWR